MTAALTVIGVSGTDGEPLTAPARAALAGARLAIGADRHLATASGLAPSAERVVLGPLAPALERLRAHLSTDGGPAVVLASGDPAFFGIVRRLRAEGFDPAVLPGVSSIAAAFARLGAAWDGAVVVSAHGRDLRPALNACRAQPLVAVLTEPGAGAAELGAGLVGWDRTLVVAEHLGTPRERVTAVTPQQAAERDWDHPHVVVCRAPGADDDDAMRGDNQPAAAPPPGWALPESAYLHRDSMITKAEVRAYVVARLRPRLGRLVWDLGAGSGSVGIECALLGAAVVAVDDDAAAGEQILANARRHVVEPAVRVVVGTAPEVLAALPDPDAVFVGGGGLEVVAAAAARRPERLVVALAALDRIAPAVEVLRSHGFGVEGTQLWAARLSDLPGGSMRLAATNPVVVLVGEQS